jgi:beta-glucanase (GH16 family)
MTGGFHTYGLIASPFMLQFYIDDPAKPFFVITAGDLKNGDTWPFVPPNRFAAILNTAVGGTLGGTPDSGTAAAGPMLVDYVRWYQSAPTAGPSMQVLPSTTTSGTGSSTLNLSAVAGSGRAYLTCSTPAVGVTCMVRTPDAINSHTIDFATVANGTAIISVAQAAGSPAPPGTYSITVDAYMMSNSNGVPDSTLTFPMAVPSQ